MVSNFKIYHYINIMKFIVANAPYISVPTEGQQFNITEGSNGSITCRATGYPVPTVVWQNSDGSILSNNRLVSGSPVISSTGVGNVSSVSVELMVIGALRVDTGMYRCSAINDLDSFTRNIIINVLCKFTYMRILYMVNIIHKTLCTFFLIL